jgi:hypothetical protein
LLDLGTRLILEGQALSGRIRLSRCRIDESQTGWG